MKFVVEKIFGDLNRTCHGAGYQFYENVLQDLINEMRVKIGCSFKLEDQHHNLRFVMNIPLYREFSIACQMSCYNPSMYRGIPISPDPSLCIGNTQYPDGIVRLVYNEEPEEKSIGSFYDASLKAFDFIGLDRGHGFQRVPHIDHVVFNGPATIVFWKDGTKTVVKHDRKGRKDKRQAILYAFIRKIYGEGKPYHNILNEIEEAIK